MKIGIIVFSSTGHTLAVAEKMAQRLMKNGHFVQIEQIVISGGETSANKNMQLTYAPDAAQYDALVLGAPVWAFSLCPAMKMYLEQLPSLQEKRIFCFVTKSLPSKWTGGNKAIRVMKKICASKKGVVIGADMIPWKANGRDQLISDAAQKAAALF